MGASPWTDATIRGHRWPVFALAVASAVLGGCALFPAAGERGVPVPPAGRVEILEPLLADRIEGIASRSPSFRAGWALVESSGVDVVIGTERQLHGLVPRWYRKNPEQWVGVNVNTPWGWGGGIRRAAVVIRLEALRRLDEEYTGGTGSYFLAEVDRVLIHEIYGHLVPVLKAGCALAECSDHPEPGATRSCVSLREEVITLELQANRGQAAGTATDLTRQAGT